MNGNGIKESLARFLMILAAMLVAMVLYFGIESIVISRPIIVAINTPFKISDDSRVIRPGGFVKYKIHYFKRLDIPGELTKQLIIKDQTTGIEYYLPLEYRSGHLPAGDIETWAFARIPNFTPDGEARIKLTSAHFTGRIRQFNTVFTETFEVRR